MPPNPEQLPAISVRQQSADLILRGEKSVEVRSQPTSTRGRVYLHTNIDNSDTGEGDASAALPRGMIVGTVEIVGCNAHDGKYEWALKNPRQLAEPLPIQQQPSSDCFYPFGQADVAADTVAGNGSANSDVLDSKPTATRFAPVIASASEPPFTAYHSKYLAYELTKRVGADQADKLAQSLSNAIVDLNPHQVDAALFAFRSPLSRGAILADEVGLGKTIEAGIIISQLWAEKK